MQIIINESEIKEAAQKGIDEFLNLFIEKFEEEAGKEICAEQMAKLNGHQNTLLAYNLFRKEINEGGFVQLIQNGYGSYIFDNPFAKAMRIFGAEKLSKLVYKAKKIYDANKKELERETTEEEFYSMYVDFEIFDDLEEEFFDIEEETTDAIAHFIDDNLGLFAEIKA